MDNIENDKEFNDFKKKLLKENKPKKKAKTTLGNKGRKLAKHRNTTPLRNDFELTPKQAKARAKSKVAKKTRKMNRNKLK